MKKKTERLPEQVKPGLHSLKELSVIRGPFENVILYNEAAHYASQYNAVFSAALMQAYRILVPDYEERSDVICRAAYDRLYKLQSGQMAADYIDSHRIHPFCAGNFVGGLHGDHGDECQLMCGRVNDFGTYRVEKELDVCDWDICGSELCRATTQSLMACADRLAECGPTEGPRLDYCMVEAKGCGDLHCRIVAESREKYPMPEHKFWETFGPIATADQIKFTPADEMVKEPEVLREDCDYTFITGTCEEHGPEMLYPNVGMSHGGTYILPAIEEFIKARKFTKEFAQHVIKCVCEAAGKALFGEKVGRKAVYDWLKIPAGVEDGRVMGAHLEMFLQCAGADYKIVSFNKEEVCYEIDKYVICGIMPDMGLAPDAYVAYWSGMVRTLVNSQWFLWTEPSADDVIRVKIGKKIDKFC